MINKIYTIKILKVFLLFFYFCFVAKSFYGTNKDFTPKTNSTKSKQLLKKTTSLLGHQPVEFLENKGQIMDSENKPAENVFFKAEAPGLDLYITKTGLSYVFLNYVEVEKSKREKRREEKLGIVEEESIKINYERIDLNLSGASIKKENIIKEDTGLAYYNFLLGPGDKSIYHVKKYRKITIKNIYEGIDWVLYNSDANGFKYDFVVHPGADASKIELIYKSKNELIINEGGNIVIESKSNSLLEKAPYSYFLESKHPIESSFKLISNKKQNGNFESHIGFNLSEKSLKQTLVIDPQLIWSTFYGGTGIEGTYCIDTDPSGNVFLCGYLGSANFPLLTMGTYFESTFGYAGFIVKFNNTGTLLWSTYFNGGTTNYLATDNSGNLFLCGTTASTLFPSTNSGTYFQPNLGGTNQDAYIAKFDALGNLTWATRYGGSGTDASQSIATDQNGNVFLVGTTTSTNFPVQNAGTYFDPTYANFQSGFIVKFDNTGNRLWASYLKGAATLIATTDLNGRIYITGSSITSTVNTIPLLNPGGTSYYQGSISSSLIAVSDAFILKFDNMGNQLWGTYYGGNSVDRGTSLSSDKLGNIFITGVTSSTNFPVQNASTFFQGNLAGSQQDVFILKFDNTATRQWATYIGGTRTENHMENDNLTIDTCGNVFLGFTTLSRNLPFQQACDGGMFDNTIDSSVNANFNNVYLARFSNTGTLMWSSLFGGDGMSFRTTLDADKFGNVFFSGEWAGATNPATYPLVYPSSPTYTSGFIGGDDLYIAKFTNNLAIQNFSYTNMCVNSLAQMPILGGGFLSGGSFSTSSNGLSLNPQTGQITSSASVPGTYTVSYLMVPCYCPGASQKSIGITTISILSAPSISISGKSTICVGEKATYTASGSSSYTWSNGSTGSLINITPSTTATIVYTLSSMGVNGCVAKKTITITVSKCTDLEEFEIGKTKLKIYPNPNSGEFIISSDQDIEFTLVNEIGQTIKQLSLTAKNERKIEIQNLANGIYFLIEKHSKQSAPYKIIVTR